MLRVQPDSAFHPNLVGLQTFLYGVTTGGKLACEYLVRSSAVHRTRCRNGGTQRTSEQVRDAPVIDAAVDTNDPQFQENLKGLSASLRRIFPRAS